MSAAKAKPKRASKASRPPKLPIVIPESEAQANANATWSIPLPIGVRPASLNEIMAGHWSKGAALKKRDRRVIGIAAVMAGVPKATGKRRVSLAIVLPKGQRRWDADGLFKSLLDALTHAEMLVDDNPKWCELGTVSYSRGERLSTIIVLEDCL